MSSVFIVLVLVSFQVFCDGAPGRANVPQLRRLPWYLPRGEYQAAKRTVNQNACLQAHNEKRALHPGTPSLTWNTELAQEAQAWANHLANDVGYMQHSSGTGEGENLYALWYSSKTDATCPDAVDAWYEEIKDYKWDDPKFSSETGHFTQVVWKGTTSVGVGIATSSQPDAEGFYSSFVVARYYPPGNYNGQFSDNVKPL